METKTLINVCVNPQVKEQVRQRAKQEDRTMSNYVHSLIVRDIDAAQAASTRQPVEVAS